MVFTTFTNGTIADADEINVNFSELRTFSPLAGENLTAGNIVYVLDSDGKVYKSDNATSAKQKAVGIALEAKNTGETILIQKTGIYTTTGLTANTVYYLGTTGALSSTLSPVRIGIATSTTELSLNIQIEPETFIGTFTTAGTSLAITGLSGTCFRLRVKLTQTTASQATYLSFNSIGGTHYTNCYIANTAVTRPAGTAYWIINQASGGGYLDLVGDLLIACNGASGTNCSGVFGYTSGAYSFLGGAESTNTSTITRFDFTSSSGNIPCSVMVWKVNI